MADIKCFNLYKLSFSQDRIINLAVGGFTSLVVLVSINLLQRCWCTVCSDVVIMMFMKCNIQMEIIEILLYECRCGIKVNHFVNSEAENEAEAATCCHYVTTCFFL